MADTKRRSKAGKRYSPVITLAFALILFIVMTSALFSVFRHLSGNTANITPMQTEGGQPDLSNNSSEPESTEPESTEPTPPPPLPDDPVERIKAYAARNGYQFSDYPEPIVELLTKNPDTEKFVLEYPFAKDVKHEIDLSDLKDCTEVPRLYQWDQRWGYIFYGSDVAGLTACGPTCMSMVAIYLTKNTDYTPAYMMQYALDNRYYNGGTNWVFFSQGAAGLGLNAQELPLSKGKIIQQLEAGNPVVCSMGPGLFTEVGHYIVLVGVEDGKFRVNDPNSIVRSNMLWEYDDIKSQIRNLWAMSKK